MLALFGAGVELVGSLCIVPGIGVTIRAIVPVSLIFTASAFVFEVVSILQLLGVGVTGGGKLACVCLPGIRIGDLGGSGSIFKIQTAAALVISFVTVFRAGGLIEV